MLTECQLLRVLNDGLVRLQTSDFSGDYGAQLWTRVTLRKSKNKTKKCCNCDSELAPGDVAFTPITNGYNRMHRICTICIERMRKDHTDG